jgi:hypothetical protein
MPSMHLDVKAELNFTLVKHCVTIGMSTDTHVSLNTPY